jgi:hypothetical protein
MKTSLAVLCSGLLLACCAGRSAAQAGGASGGSGSSQGTVGGMPDLPTSMFERVGSRDPFNPPGWRPPEEPAPVEEPDERVVEPEVELRLTGMIRSGGERLAILNGRILAKGERAVLRRGRRTLRVHVLEVGENEVLVSAGGRKTRLRLEHGNLGGME